MTDPINLETRRMIRELQAIGEAERDRTDKITNLFWSRWGLEQDNVLAVYKLAAPWFEDFLQKKPLISETELANAVFFYHRFCRRFHFLGDLDRDKVSEVSEAITPMPIREMREAALEMGLEGSGPEVSPPPADKPPADEPDAVYLWAVSRLGLRETPDLAEWMDEMDEMHGGDRAELLLRTIDILVWSTHR